MKQKSTAPRDAAAIILVRDGDVLWAQRNPQVKFLGGWHAFPGGKTEESDAEIAVANCADDDLRAFIVSAVRECFEEVGVLIVRNGERLTRGQRASLHDDLTSGRSSFAEILTHWNLHIDAEDFEYAGFWTTPQFSPVRFKTRFFIAQCPAKQEPYAALTEMLTPEFIAPAAALDRWTNAEVLISPPVLITLQTLAETKNAASKFGVSTAQAQTLRHLSARCDGEIDYIRFNPHITVYPLKTATLPPATHTNCFIVGEKEFVVIDAAARDAGERAKLHHFIDGLMEKGGVCRAIIVSHSHPDHTGGETVLRDHLRDKFGVRVPLAAHEKTAEDLRETTEFDEKVTDGERFELADADGEKFELTALHTPGHAGGHLAFYDETKSFLLSSDTVVAGSSVVIAPPDGNLKDYLASLERLKSLPNLRFLCGSHGSAVYDARAKIGEYAAHRLERERQILAAMAAGAETAGEIAASVYAGLDERLMKLAELSVTAHLEKLSADGRL